ncbi:transposable element Tcb2 transposase [Trichonephila clavipes]|nr:transposable element Tcb2 transposase [Trichonephila clavipes]
MMASVWSAKRVARQLGHSKCVAYVPPSLGVPVSSQAIRRRLAEGHLGLWHPLLVLPLTPTHRCLRLEWCGSRGNWTAVEGNQVLSSDETRFNISRVSASSREFQRTRTKVTANMGRNVSTHHAELVCLNARIMHSR